MGGGGAAVRLPAGLRPITVMRRRIATARSLPPRTLLRFVLQRVWPFYFLSRLYYRVRYADIVWRLVLNRKARRAMGEAPPMPDAVQQRAVDALREKGICMMSLNELWGGPGMLDELLAARDAVLEQPSVAAQIGEGYSAHGKDFVVRCLGDEPSIDLASPFVRLALSDRVLDVVNTYLSMYGRLTYLDVWFNLPVPESQAPVASQGWHRDYDDRKVVKLFVYLVDVDERRGPFTYLEGSHAGGRYARLFTRSPGSSYPPNDAVEAALPDESVRTCTGQAGTAILVDTAGLHRGGRSVSDPRILFTAFYLSDAAYARSPIRLVEGQAYETLPPAARFAIRFEHAGARAN